MSQLTRRGRNFDRLDPTDYEGLPERWWESGIDYVRQTLPPNQQTAHVVRLFLRAAATGAVASVLVLLVAPFIGHLEMLPVILTGSTLFGLLLTVANKTAEIREHIFVPVFVLIGWGICYAAEQHSYAVFLLVFIYALLIGQQSALHFAFLRCAPPVSDETRQQIGQMRWRGFPIWMQLFSVPAIALTLGPRLTLHFEQTPASLWAQPLTAAALAVFLLCWPILWALLLRQDCTFIDMCRGTWLAIRSYTTYGKFTTDRETARYESTPLTFYSPAGLFKFREFSMFLAIVGVAVALLPFCDYFPTGKVNPAPFDFHALLSVKPDYDPTIPELSAEEQETIHRLRMPPYYADRSELIAKLQQWGHENPEELLGRVIPVRAYPGNWILHALFGARDDTSSLYSVCVSIIFAVVAPGVFFFLLCFAIGGNYNGAVYAMTKHPFAAFDGSNPTPDTRINEDPSNPVNAERTAEAAKRWNSLVTRLQSNPVTKDYIYVGRNKALDSPMAVHIDHFKQHSHYLGGSGRGKTALGLAPLICQLIRRGDCNVIVFDLKYDSNDRSFFENARIEAHDAGHDFKFFTTTANEPTHICNPLLESELTPPADVGERAPQLCEALGLLYGQKYGESYYAEAHNKIARKMLAKIMTEDGYHLRESLSFPRLQQLLEQIKAEAPKSERKLVEDAAHLESIVEKYALIPTINYLPENTPPELLRGSIQFDDLHRAEKPQVYFFGLNAERDPDRTGGLTRLFLNRLMKVGVPPGHRKRQTFIIVDEFQMAAAPQFTRLLEQARSAKMGLVLANQSIARIKDLGGPGLEAALFDNIAYRQVCQVESVEELKRFETLAGKYSREHVTRTEVEDPLTGVLEKTSKTFSITEDSRFDVTDWRVMNANRQQSVMFATINIGYTRTNGLPVLIESDYHISFKDNQERAMQPPPDLTPETTTSMEFSKFLRANAGDIKSVSSGPKMPSRFQFGSDDPED